MSIANHDVNITSDLTVPQHYTALSCNTPTAPYWVRSHFIWLYLTMLCYAQYLSSPPYYTRLFYMIWHISFDCTACTAWPAYVRTTFMLRQRMCASALHPSQRMMSSPSSQSSSNVLPMHTIYASHYDMLVIKQLSCVRGVSSNEGRKDGCV